MTQRFLPCERDQQYLMPASLRDWLPEDHLAWFVLDAVSQLDLTAFYARYREDGWGRKAYEPSMMVALLLYAYCEGERSSRQIERRCREDIAFRVLTANQQPDHATICRFRQQHEQALAGLFAGVLRLCAEAGLLRVGVVALDGTKLRANASRERNRTDAELEAEVRRILAEAERVDAEEHARGDARGDELPAGFRDRGERLQRLREARERLAARERERQEDYEERLRSRAQKDRRGRRPQPPQPGPGAKVNVTDPDSRVVRDYHGYFQGYNVQAVTSSDQIIVVAEVTRAATDMHELQPMIEATNPTCRPHTAGRRACCWPTPATTPRRTCGRPKAGVRSCCSRPAATATGAPAQRRRAGASLPGSPYVNGWIASWRRSVAGVSTSSGAG